MSQHLKYLGYLYLGFGVIGLLLAAFVFFLLRGGGLIAGDPDAAFALSTAGVLLGLFFTILALPSFVLSFGLLTRQAWSRPLGYVVGGLSVFHFPIGTGVAIYTFWVLLQDEAVHLLNN